MSRHDEIKNAYKSLGGEATFYDGMITCSTLPGKAVCEQVWNMDKRQNDRYLELAVCLKAQAPDNGRFSFYSCSIPAYRLPYLAAWSRLSSRHRTSPPHRGSYMRF